MDEDWANHGSCLDTGLYLLPYTQEGDSYITPLED